MRKYTVPQILAFILSFFLPPLGIWLAEGLGPDFWLNCLFTLLGLIPGSIHACYVWAVWVERKWQTHHGHAVTAHPFLIFSKEFERRSRWRGNGQDGVFGYLDDNLYGADGRPGYVGGQVDAEQARPVGGTGTEMQQRTA